MLSWNISTANALILIVLLAVAIIALNKMAGDPYGTFHLGLNIREGQDPTKAPDTEWLNMGYWKVYPLYPIHLSRLICILGHQNLPRGL